MSNKLPSIQEWKDLYDAAIEFKKMQCWNWMWDSDIFGVQNPVSGEISYCCVMGGLGELYALAVYLGPEGLEGYLKIRSEEISLSDIDMLHTQKCLMASFEDRNFLQKPDLQVVNKLNLKFRGRNSWPLFRSYRPVYHPWYLSSNEAKFLTLALQQTMEVSLRSKKDPDILISPKKNHHLVRVPKRDEDGLRWIEEWLEPLPLEKTKIVTASLDENHLEKIKRMITQRQGIWEIDFSYLSQGVREKEERPYYPYVIFCVEHYSGFILNSYLASPIECMLEFAEQFLKFVENFKSLPQEILVKKEETLKLLEPVTSRLGIRLRRVKRLIALEEARTSMSKFFT